MKFSVGYNSQGEMFLESIFQNREIINEVYFAYPDFANGRNSTAVFNDINPFEYEKKLENDLLKISKNGIALNLLLNGLCYGKYAQSRAFFFRIGDLLEHLCENFTLSGVTTTSPLIAKFIKENFPDIEVRASVNMEIGTIEGMEYLAEYFDSFYAKRECNRDLEQLKKLRKWCDENGKKLYGLANSGCLNFCSAHTFHDNLVSHESEISEMDNAYQFEGQCRIYLKDEQKRENWFRISNFIRPEDVGLYESIFDGLKLATRVNKNPQKVLNAYIKKSFNGNLPEIMEPDHSALFYPDVVENKKIPEDFAVKTTTCDKNCDTCGYCKSVLKDSSISLE